jgi:hypothetical protein
MKFIRVFLIIAFLIVGFMLWQELSGVPDEIAKETSATFLSRNGIEIIIDEPQIGEGVSPSFVVKGKAPGTWYFEATFPIFVVDDNDNVIGSCIAQAQSDWMVEDYVAFEGLVEIENKSSLVEGGLNAVLILRRDNPSGLPENDDFVEVPIVVSGVSPG